MTTPAPAPTLEQLARIVGEIAPHLRWLEGMHRGCTTTLMQQVQAVAQTTLSEAQARTVMWQILDTLGRYVREIQPTPEPAPEATTEVAPGETFD